VLVHVLLRFVSGGQVGQKVNRTALCVWTQGARTLVRVERRSLTLKAG